MSGPFFDVFVVGASDASPDGLIKLASALSGPLGMPATLISKALAERKLCAGKGLVQQDAQALVRDLKPLGALTVVRPTGPNDTPTRLTAPPTPTPRPVPPPPVRPAPPPPVRATAPRTEAIGTRPPLTAISGPPSLSLEPEPNDDFAAPPSGPKGADPFAPPSSGPKGLALDAPASMGAAIAPDLDLAVGGRSEAPAGHDPFAGGAEDPGLELDVPPPKAAPAPAPVPRSSAPMSAEKKRTSSSVAGASALNLNRMSASSSASGLSVDREVAAEAYRVRCHKHGLLYDTRKASGCGKCLEAGRKLSAAIDARAAGFKIADFGDEAWKRAFIGLAVALVVGFIPAAYHAFRIGAHDIHRLRDEQEMLSRKPATEEIVRNFEDLDRSVESAANRAARTTGLVWLVMSGATLLGWYRVTS